MKKIAIAVLDDKGIEAKISQHFGHSPYFTFVDVVGKEMHKVETIANPHHTSHQPGEIPAFLQSQGADVILTGGMGGRAVEFFRQYGIEPATGASGIARDALTRYLEGNLNKAEPCSESADHGHD